MYHPDAGAVATILATGMDFRIANRAEIHRSHSPTSSSDNLSGP